MKMNEGAANNESNKERGKDHRHGHNKRPQDSPHPMTDMNGQPEGAVRLRKKLREGKALKELLFRDQFTTLNDLTTHVTRCTLHGGQGN
jgi:hypothetical protein